ncbi:MAG TPA: nuclear transport factor 2 family protein [Candidatus Binataceae bacterium]|nr:nuclear transport factor 2 family protein [Candidatus Binataceae bacterium]
MDVRLIRKEIEDAEQQEAEAMLQADIHGLDGIWDEQLLAYSTANLYARKSILLDLIRMGGLRLRSHIRKTLEVTADGGTAIAIGNERTEFKAEGSSGTILICSYLNVWVRRSEGWRLFGRHVGQIARAPANGKNE